MEINFYMKEFAPVAVLQIRRGKRDNLGIIFSFTPFKHVVNSLREGSNERVTMYVFVEK